MGMKRRDFVKTTAAAAVASALGVSLKIPSARAEVPPGEKDVDKWVKGTCRFCGVGCRMYLGVKNGKAVAVKGVENSKTNFGFLCMKAFLQYKIYNHPDRLKYPLLRQKNGEFKRISWDKAMDIMATKFAKAIKKYGKNSVAYYGSGQALTEETYLIQKIFRAGIGNSNVEGNPRLCMASAVGGYLTTFGKDEPSGSYADIEKATCFFLIGTNQAEAHPVVFRRVMNRKLSNPDGVKVIVADPRVSPTSRIADLHMQFLPGTDLAVMHAMANVIVNEGLYNKEFVDKFVAFKTVKNGKPANLTFEEYKKFLDDFTPEKAEKISKCPADQIRKAARWFAKSSATMSMWTMGLNQRIRGVWANNLVHNLHLLTGQIGKPGADSFSLTGQPNACGGVREAGGLCHILPGHRLVAKKAHREQIAKIWGIPEARLPKKPGYHTVAMFKALTDGKIKAMLIHTTNPTQSLPNLTPVIKGFKRKDNFIVVTDIFPTRTTQLADLVLPAAFLFEKPGVYGCTEHRSQLTQKALDPPGEAREEIHIFREFSIRLGKKLKDPVFTHIVKDLKTSEDVWNDYRKCTKGQDVDLWGATYERLRKAPDGLQWPVPTVTSPGTPKRYVKGIDPLAKGKEWIQFYGKPNGRALVWARPYKGPAEMPDAEYPFYLTTVRVIEQWHTMTMTGRVPELLRGFPYSYVEINPKDAKRLGIKHGDMIEIKSRRGKVELPAKIVEGPMEGIVAVPWHDQNMNRMINFVTIEAFDPGSKEPEYKICAVKIRKISGPRRLKPTTVKMKLA